jgi:hypothetical protein
VSPQSRSPRRYRPASRRRAIPAGPRGPRPRPDRTPRRGRATPRSLRPPGPRRRGAWRSSSGRSRDHLEAKPPSRGAGRPVRGSRRAQESPWRRPSRDPAGRSVDPRPRSARGAAPLPAPRRPRRRRGAHRPPHRIAQERPRPTSYEGSRGPPSRSGRVPPWADYRTDVRTNQGVRPCDRRGSVHTQPTQREFRPRPPSLVDCPPRGDVAQLEEHRVRIAGVRGSSPLISTISRAAPGAWRHWVGWAGGEPKGL